MTVFPTSTVPATVTVFPTSTVPATVYVPVGDAVTVPETGCVTPEPSTVTAVMPLIPWMVTTPVSAVPAVPRPVTVWVPETVADKLPVTV